MVFEPVNHSDTSYTRSRESSILLSEKIKHVIVLMLEDRSYDHLFGYLKGEKYEKYGCSKLPEAKHLSQAKYVTRFIPGHEPEDVQLQLEFCLNGSNKTAFECYQESYILKIQKLWAEDSFPLKPDTDEMNDGTSVFKEPEKQIPIISTLAKEFALCTSWFCSIRGPTWPNRYFSHSGTNDGLWSNRGYNHAKTLFNSLNENGKSWRVYFHDIMESTLCKQMWTAALANNVRRFSRFEQDVRNDNLTDYVLLEPKYYGPNSNDQHPPSNVTNGEELILNVYRIMYENMHVFEKSILVITYDEHGGFYDHAKPPDQLGPRIVTILVSPNIDAATILPEVYEHSSLLKSILQLFHIEENLGRTSQCASVFENLRLNHRPRSQNEMPDPNLLKEALNTARSNCNTYHTEVKRLQEFPFYTWFRMKRVEFFNLYFFVKLHVDWMFQRTKEPLEVFLERIEKEAEEKVRNGNWEQEIAALQDSLDTISDNMRDNIRYDPMTQRKLKETFQLMEPKLDEVMSSMNKKPFL